MLRAPARVSLAAGGGGALACALCTAAGDAPPQASVVVQHPRGGVVQLAACDWCVQAVRRLAAATGGPAEFAVGGAPPAPAGAGPPRRGARPAGPAVLLREAAALLSDPADGTRYVARVYGRARADGTWEGWLEFVAVGAAVVLRTAQETTQSSRDGAAYWAAGLEPTYLEGALARALRDRPPALAP